MTALPSRLIYLEGTDIERDCEAFMRFRLTYEGPLLSSNPLAPEKRVEHKHAIRRVFHRQLKELWETNRFLRLWKLADDLALTSIPSDVYQWKEPNHLPAAQALAKHYGHDGYGFVPLVQKDLFLGCSLRVLCLRRDGPDAVSAARDIDNRMKTLLDALTWVSHKD